MTHHLYEQIKQQELRNLIKRIWLQGIYQGIISGFYPHEDKQEELFEEALKNTFKELKNDNKV